MSKFFTHRRMIIDRWQRIALKGQLKNNGKELNNRYLQNLNTWNLIEPQKTLVEMNAPLSTQTLLPYCSGFE